eukprot:Ihof_evm13s3 gene=Ihof_evmTU13s3
MGCTVSVADKVAYENTKMLDSQIKTDKEILRNDLKLLLLGPKESGKSTVVKQMRIIHASGFTKEEYMAHREIIYCNIVISMLAMLKALPKLNIELSANLQVGANRVVVVGVGGEKYSQLILDLEEEGYEEDPYMSPPIADALTELWASQPIKEAYGRTKEYQLQDSTKYYFSALKRIFSPDYLPNAQDVLRSRVETTGIIETQFMFRDSRYRMLDVGGQRSERKKWIHCFENVDAIVFCAPLGDYDMPIDNDRTMNRLYEALKMFDSICNSKWFLHTSIILFLNKTDTFKEKLDKTPLSFCLPLYQ